MPERAQMLSTGPHLDSLKTVSQLRGDLLPYKSLLGEAWKGYQLNLILTSIWFI